jgi:hypothetical protein
MNSHSHEIGAIRARAAIARALRCLDLAALAMSDGNIGGFLLQRSATRELNEQRARLALCEAIVDFDNGLRTTDCKTSTSMMRRALKAYRCALRNLISVWGLNEH